MNLLNRFIYSALAMSILVVLTAVSKPQQFRTDCDELKINVTVVEGKNVNVQIAGARGKRILHLIGPKGKASENIDLEELKDLSVGKYTLIVIDQVNSDDYCQQYVEFTIK
jgi:hypothetical protein